MLLPSNWILVLAALPYARNHESCFAFLCFIQILNTHTLPSYTALTHTHTEFFLKEQLLQEVVTKLDGLATRKLCLKC